MAEVERAAQTSSYGKQGYLLWLALVVSIVVSLWVQLPRIRDPYAVEEDFRKFSYMHRFQEPSLLPDDSEVLGSLLEVNLGPTTIIMDTSSPGYSLLFQAASYAVPVITFSKILGIPLLLTAVYFMYRIGERLRGPGTGLGLALAFTALNMASPASLTVLTGLQRAFMAPLVLAVLYYLLTERDRAAAVVLVLAGLLYLPAFALGAATYGLTLISWNGERRRPRFAVRRAAPLVVATALVLLIQAPTAVMQLDRVPDAPVEAPAPAVVAEPSDQPAPAVARSDDAGSRYELFRLYPLVGRGGLSDGMALAAYIAVLSAMAVFTFAMNPSSPAELPRTIKLMAVAGVLCFILAWTAYWLFDAFLLYLPSRYSQAALFLFTLIYVVVNLEETTRRTAAALHANRRRMVWLLLPLSLLAVLLVIFLPPDSLGKAVAGDLLRWLLILLALVLVLLGLLLRRRSDDTPAPRPQARPRASRWRWALLGGLLFLAGLGNVWVMNSQFLVSSPEERELYQFLESLPVDVLVSGNPCDLDGIPLFARRMVLFSCERPRSDALALDTLLAYYAAESKTIADYCQRYEVDYLVVNAESFERESLAAGDYYFEPLSSQLQPLLSQQQNFALPDIAAEAAVFANDTYAVVPCDGLALANHDGK